jgi:hypothetical protein
MAPICTRGLLVARSLIWFVDYFPIGGWSETQVLRRSVRNQVVHIAGEPTPHSLQALKRTSTGSDSRNIGEAQIAALSGTNSRSQTTFSNWSTGPGRN